MRFSIRGLLFLTAVVGVASAVFVAVPNWIAAIVLAFWEFILPASLVAAVIYARGYGRAFAIGALLPAGSIFALWVYYAPMYLMVDGPNMGNTAAYSDTFFLFKIGFAIQAFLTVSAGLTAVGVHWLCLRPQSKSQKVSPTLAQITSKNVSEFEIQPRDKAELYAILHGRVGE